VLGQRIEIEAARKDGTLLPVELAITEVRVEGRRMFTAYLRDLSERRAAEGELLRQREALYQREKLAALGSLLAGVAHELSNPLAIVVGQAQLLLETSVDTKARQRAEKIQAAAERCARIVRAFLDMARQREPVHRDVDLNALVEKALELVAYGLSSSGIEVRRDLKRGLPRVAIDPDQVHQVVTNLLMNARQALEDRPEPRRLVVSTRMGERDCVRLEVSDNGPGIAPEIRARILEPFFTTKPMGAGTGLGLSISHGLVEQNGGRLSFFDLPAGGTCFVVDLPAAVAPQPAARRRRLYLPKAHTRQALVVDDEPEITKLVRDVLQTDGFMVEVAASGREAMTRLEGREFDAILCDLRMPGMDGPALHAWLCETRPAQSRRMLFVTGDTLGPAARRFLAEAGQPVLEKPFLPADLRRAVAELLANLGRR